MKNFAPFSFLLSNPLPFPARCRGIGMQRVTPVFYVCVAVCGRDVAKPIEFPVNP